MKRFITPCLVAIMLVLSGCRSIDFIPWTPYVGSIPTAHPEENMKIEVDSNGNIILFDYQYHKLEIGNDLMDQVFPSSGWRINLDEMVSFGVKEQRNIILMIPKGEDRPVICTIDTISDDVSVYFREDIAKEGISYFDYSQFHIYYDDILVEEDIHVKRLWEYHTQAKDDVSQMMIMEESATDCCILTFVHKDIPAIQYELQFKVWDYMLCMDNIVANRKIYIPMDQFLGIE